MNDERVRKLIREELRKLLAAIFHAAETRVSMSLVTSDPHAPGESEMEPWRGQHRHHLPESSEWQSGTGTDGETDTVSTVDSSLNRMRQKAKRMQKRERSAASTRTKPVLP